MTSSIYLVAKERYEQLTKHGRTISKDLLGNDGCQLREGALKLLSSGNNATSHKPPLNWDPAIFRKMRNKKTIDRLVCAAALLLAEIDRISFDVRECHLDKYEGYQKDELEYLIYREREEKQ